MMKTVLAAALLVAAPMFASAATFAAVGNNNLSVDDYFDQGGGFDYAGSFTLTFTADDAARDVTVSLASFSAQQLGDFGISVAGAGSFDLGAALPQSFMFALAQGETFDIIIGTSGPSIEAKVVNYDLSISSTLTPTPVPLPAALPMIAVALGALGLAARRRKA